MPRPILILIIAVIAVIVILFGLAALDREVPQMPVERPLSNAAAR